MVERNSSRGRQMDGKQLSPQKSMAEDIGIVVVEDAWREVRKCCTAPACIATTRIIVNLFEHFWFEAVPLHVEAVVWNPAWVDAAGSSSKAWLETLVCLVHGSLTRSQPPHKSRGIHHVD